jgi:hypothetical protein
MGLLTFCNATFYGKRSNFRVYGISKGKGLKSFIKLEQEKGKEHKGDESQL